MLHLFWGLQVLPERSYDEKQSVNVLLDARGHMAPAGAALMSTQMSSMLDASALSADGARGGAASRLTVASEQLTPCLGCPPLQPPSSALLRGRLSLLQ